VLSGDVPQKILAYIYALLYNITLFVILKKLWGFDYCDITFYDCQDGTTPYQDHPQNQEGYLLKIPGVQS
jgi:hypothetical protein